jgi:hypothetical protein
LNEQVKTVPIYLLLCLFCATSIVATAQVQIIWDESTNGPLSGDYTHPTILPDIALGSNIVIGSVQIIPNQYGATTYPDYFVVTIPPGLQVDQMVLSSDVTALWVWIGNTGFSRQLGFIGNLGAGTMDPTNGDLLPQMGIGPIISGTYGVYVQNNASGTSTAHYQLDFVANVATVPTTPPNLTISVPVPGLLQVSWPNTGLYTLQQNTNLADSAGWTTTNYMYTTANSTSSVAIFSPASTTGNVFFRLSNP